MIHVTYYLSHDARGRVVGYEVCAYDYASSQVHEEHYAGNHPHDTKQRLPADHPNALGRTEILQMAKQTAVETAKEFQETYPEEKVLCYWDAKANAHDREMAKPIPFHKHKGARI